MLVASLFAVVLTSTSFLNLPTTTVKAEVNSILNNATVKVTAVQAPLYNKFGERLSRSLTQGSAWKVNSQNNIPSGTFYQVASNEFVKASDVYLYDTVQPNLNQTIRITTNYAAPVSNGSGQIIPGRYLDTPFGKLISMSLLIILVTITLVIMNM